MAGASVEIAANGKAAVEAFEASYENYYDYILMDIQMPVMDGYSAAKRFVVWSVRMPKNYYSGSDRSCVSTGY